MEYTPPAPEATNWNTIAKANIHTSVQDVEVFSLASLGNTSTNITYVAAEVKQFALDSGTLVVGTETEDNLDLGSATVNKILVNKLVQCGVALDERCTSSRLIVYTTEIVGHTGVEGFVNTDESYGVPIIITATTGGATGAAGLTDVNAFVAETVDLSTISKRRLTSSDFINGPYLINVDFSNAGNGNYEMDLVVELQVGN